MDESEAPLAPVAGFAESVHDSAIVMAILDDRDVMVYANRAFAVHLGLDDPNTLVGKPPVPAWTTDADKAAQAALEQRVRDHGPSTLTLKFNDERAVTFYLEPRHAARRIVVALADGPMPVASHERLNQLDPLTGLGNRLLFETRLRDWTAADTGQPGAVIMLDLDRFKQVNDTLGHLAGDELLTLVARRMRSVTRAEDTLVRLGGDEFAVLQTQGVQPDGARSLAARLVSLMSSAFLIDGHQVNTGASVGIAMLGAGTDKPADLLKHADLALYEAKRLGRSRFCFFEAKLARRALGRRQIELDLRRALGLRQLSLLYQPQHSILDQTITGFEALIRWEHPVRGVVSPVEFIPLAEEIGEINAIGEWVIHTACKEAMTWGGAQSVAVNVSPLQFENDDIVAIVRRALATTGLAPERLELEITEGTLMGESEAVLQRLWTIKDMGVGIAMDDFGTGYASLSYLNSFPFTKIKIDKSFIQAKQSPRSKALVEAIVKMGASLGMVTIAEGVETLAQYEEIARGGCATVQGYYIAKPMPPEAIAEYLRSLTIVRLTQKQALELSL